MNPIKAQRQRLKQIIKLLKPYINNFQMKCLLENLNETVTTNDDQLITVRELLLIGFTNRIGRGVALHTSGKVNSYLVKLVVAINGKKYHKRNREQLMKKGKLISVVQNTAVYTYGASITLGYELVVFGYGNQTIGVLVNSLLDKELIVGVPLEHPDFKISSTGEPTRYLLVEVDRQSAVKEIMFACNSYRELLPNEYKVYQVLLGDINNLLPGEEGYNYPTQKHLPTI